MVIKNTAEIRQQNTKKIVNYLRWSEPVTKKELADMLGLSFATVSNICNELLEQRVLGQTSSMNSGGGRIPGLLFLNPDSKYYLCINLMQKEILELALLNFKSYVIDIKKLEIQKNETFDELLEKACGLKAELLKSKEVNEQNLIGAGVSISGIYDKKTQLLVTSHNPVYKNQPIGQKFTKAFGLPVVVENDTNLLVLAASDYYRNGMKNNDAVYLYMGEGLGTGIISEGRIVTGRNGLGGETNHIPLGTRNYQCYCGNRNCVETELSLKGFLRKYQEEAGLNFSFTAKDWEDFVGKVRSGDKCALSVITENGVLFGKLIASIVNIFGTEDFYIGGITEKIFEDLKPYIIEEARKRIFVCNAANVNISNSIDYENLIFRGCSEMLFNEWMP